MRIKTLMVEVEALEIGSVDLIAMLTDQGFDLGEAEVVVDKNKLLIDNLHYALTLNEGVISFKKVSGDNSVQWITVSMSFTAPVYLSN